MSVWNATGATRTHEQGVATRHRTCLSKLRKANLGASDATAQFDPHVSWVELRSNAVLQSTNEYISKTDNISGILNARQCVRQNQNEDPSQISIFPDAVQTSNIPPFLQLHLCIPQRIKAATPAAPAKTIAISYTKALEAAPVYGKSVVFELLVGAADWYEEPVAVIPIAASVGLMVLVAVPAGAMVATGATSLTAAGVAVTPGTVALKVTP